MIRHTSIEAYNIIEENGLLSKLRWEVYKCLFHHGPLSQNEASYKLRGKLDWGINPRFSELEKMGIIKTVGERPDRHTGNNVLVWDVTASLPRKLEKIKEPTRREIIQGLYKLVASAPTKVRTNAWLEAAGVMLKASAKYTRKREK